MITLDNAARDVPDARQMNGRLPASLGSQPCGRHREAVPSTRSEARKQGKPRYFTGKACKHGHIAERLTNGGCVTCKQILAAKWYKENSEFAREVAKNYRAAHPYKWSPEAAVRRSQWYKANAERIKSRIAKWRTTHREHIRVWYHNREARKNGVAGKHHAKDILEIFNRQRGKCAHSWCRKPLRRSTEYHIDHIVPLAIGGSNRKNNLQILCVACNLAKGSKHPIDFARQNGALL